MSSAKQRLQELIKQRKASAISKIIPVDKSASTNQLSFAQQRLWFLSRYMGPNSVYNMSLSLHLTGKVNVQAILRSLSEIVTRHESLRTRFEAVSDTAIQRIDEVGISLQLEDVESFEQLKVIDLAERSYPFNLQEDALCRIRLFHINCDDSYGLLVTMHHSISDGWSLGVFFKELVELYQAFSRGNPSPLSPLPIQYSDFSHWQREWLQGNVLEKQLSYWKTKLDGLPPLLNLPTDRPRPNEQTFNGRNQSIFISKEITNNLLELSKRNGATLFMSLLSAFFVLLSRYTNQKDFAVGTPIANRTRKETEGLIGFFTNTLVMRANLNQDPSFVQLLELTRETALQAYANQDIPFEKLVEAISGERSLSHSPIFQVMFVLQNVPMESAILSDLELKTLTYNDIEEGNSPGVSRFDLTLNLQESPEGLSGSIEYNTDLFDQTTIECLIEHYQNLLTAILKSPATPISKLEILSDSEIKQQLYAWNDTRASFPEEACVNQLFEIQVKNNPDSIALVYEEQQISYAELNRRANQIANNLINLGVRPEARVGICLERSPIMVIGILAILKSGGCYVPLDSEYPRARLAFLIEDSNIEILVTSTLLRQSLFTKLSNEFNLCYVELDEQFTAVSHKTDNPVPLLSPQNLAYVIYTSGSTGTPKGVLISHNNITSLVANGNAIDIKPQDIVAQLSSYSFDAITYEMWGTLVNGARLILTSKEIALQPSTLKNIISTQKLTTLFITTALFNRICNEERNCFDTVEKVLFGGEAFSSEAIEIALDSRLQHLHHVYGPTEATTFATSFELKKETFLISRNAPIGTPLANKKTYVINENRLTPTGAEGELYIGGKGLARGYLNNAALTAEKFVPNPFSVIPGERLYHTGDLVQQLKSGEFIFKGRADQQIKIRGFRVELGEIENALIAQSTVKEAVVIVEKEGLSSKRIIAYVVLELGQNDSKDRNNSEIRTIRGALTQLLPQFLLPSAIIILDELPLTINGKLNKDALPSPDVTEKEVVYTAPSTPTELILAEVWQQKMRLEKIGIDDNYFVLGGDSIRSIALVSEAKKRGLEFSVKDLFANPTIKQLATMLDENKIESSELVTIAPFELLSDKEYQLLERQAEFKNIQDAFPLSMMQQGMILLAMKHKELNLYENLQLYQFNDEWDEIIFRKTIEYIVKKHQMLRSICYFSESRPLQFILNFKYPSVNVNNSFGKSTKSVEKILDNWIREEKEKGIDATKELWRISVHLISKDKFIIGLMMHHSLLDGWSLESLASELSAIYSKYHNGIEPEKIGLLPSYNQFIALEQKALGSQSQIEYWKDKLVGATLPWWTGKNKSSSFEFSCNISRENSLKISTLAQKNSVQEKSIWCSVYLVLLALLNGSEEIVGTVSTQGRPEITGGGEMIGLFINALPIKGTLQGVSWRDFIINTDRDLREQHEFRFYPLAEIQRVNGVELSGALFNYTNWHVYNEKDNSYIEEVHSNSAASSSHDNVQQKISKLGGFRDTNYQFYVDAFKDEMTNEFGMTISADSVIFDQLMCNRIPEYVDNIIEQLLSNIDYKIDKSLLLSKVDKDSLIFPLNDVNYQPDSINCLYDYVERQSQEHPDSIALVCGNNYLSYSELNRNAICVAKKLIELGISQEKTVGICIERSIEMIIGLLAIIKAGGSYLPLDYQFPKNRLAYIVSDSEIDLILVQASTQNIVESVKSTISGNNLDGISRTIKSLDIESLLFENKTSLNKSKTVNLPKIDIHNLAYVLYTSGSTGKPKGVRITHGNAINFLSSMSAKPGIGRRDRLLAVTTLSFDIALLEIFLPLSVGACIDIAKQQCIINAEALASRITTQEISLFQATPVTWNALLESSWSGNRYLTALVGGDILSQNLAEKLSVKVGRLWNMYGPTETTVWSTIFEFSSLQSVVSIGSPISNTQVYVFDSQQNPCPIGVPGELYIGGAGLAQGYLGKPGLTAARFIPNAMEDGSGQRLYRTGDLVRLNTQGILEFIGRLDNQVKIRGHRIELGEIEKVLFQHGQVKNCAVLAQNDETGKQCLVAYVVSKYSDLQGQNTLTTIEDITNELRNFVLLYLPSYMVPSRIELLESMPLTSNGKIDRTSLSSKKYIAHDISHEEPEGQTEILIAEFWKKLLDCDKASRNDSFFALGGHSLLATQLVSWIQREFKVELPIQSLFEEHTLRALATKIEKLKEESKITMSKNKFNRFKEVESLVSESSDIVEEGEI